MRFTDRLNLKLPEPADSYNIQDFTDNFQQIVDSLAGIPTITNYLTLEEFINSGTADKLKRGDTVAINNLIYILVGSDPLNASHYMVYGAEALVVMREYVPISERIKGSMYLQLGKTRGLIVRVFKKFYNREYTETDTNDTITFKQTTEKTTNITDGARYRFTCKNLSILAQGDTSERLDGKIYFVADTKE